MKKLHFLVFVVLTFVAGMSLPAFAPAAEKPIVLTAHAYVPQDMPVMLGYEAWSKEIEKRTNGQVQFKFYWAQSLMKAVDAIRGTGQGIADVAISVPAYHPSETPFGTVGEMGFITNAPDASGRALGALHKSDAAFRNQFERHNVKVMFFVPFPPNIMGFKGKQIKTLEDFKGMKVRAIGELNEVVARLGGIPVAIPAMEVYEAIDRGVINGYTGWPLSAVKGFKLEETAKNYLDFGYGNYMTPFICFNKDKWNSLPADIQKIIEQVNALGIDIYTSIYAKEEPKYIQALKDANCTFYILPGSEVTRWKKILTPGIWDKWVEKNSKYGDARAFFDAYLKEVHQYETKSTYINPFPGK
jgi:TRAP-type C4-dicarboxylate transport system substrate-binding protein